jgi:hypothetical protein
MCMICKIMAGLCCLLGTLATIAAVVGLYNAHFVAGGFGSQPGSLSLIALFLALMFCKKMSKCCPCRSKGCGSSCGDKACACGMPGGKCVCPSGAPHA